MRTLTISLCFLLGCAFLWVNWETLTLQRVAHQQLVAERAANRRIDDNQWQAIEIMNRGLGDLTSAILSMKITNDKLVVTLSQMQKTMEQMKIELLKHDQRINKLEGIVKEHKDPSM
jgi:pyridoxal/pyridoxine/pyridoxamine kinase